MIAGEFWKPWAIVADAFLSLRAGGRGWASGRPGAGAARKTSGPSGTVAIIPIYGVITQREGFRQQIGGGISIERLTAEFRQALSDSSVGAIAFDVDSGGGELEGIPELANEILRARGRKRIVAIANPVACAGAYWLACSASEVAMTPSGQVGSIGIVAAHEDVSRALDKAGVRVSIISAGRYKTEGNPFEPLAPGARADLQHKVDVFHDMFVAGVAQGRGVQVSRVRNGFGQGRAALSRAARAEGMVDRIETLDQVLARLTGGPGATPEAPDSIALQRLRLDLHAFRGGSHA